MEVLEERQNGTQEEPVKKSGRKGLFSEGLYQEGSVFGKMFQQETEEEQEKRKIIPVADEQAEQETVVSTEQMEVFKPEQKKRDEKKTVSEVDIEKLMRQMTQKLWEEREGCGRRLR